MKILFLNGPSQDSCDRFFGLPTSLLYAIAPTVQAVRQGSLPMEVAPKIFDPVWYKKGTNDKEVHLAFRQALRDVTVVVASTTYDSLHPTLELLREAKRATPPPVTILGGPHVDEIRNLPQVNEFAHSGSPVDIAVAGDGEYVLLKILQNISHQRHPLQDINDTAGSAWVWIQGEDSVVENQGPQLDLNSLPIIPVEMADMVRHSHDFDIFRTKSGEILPTIQMIAQRGCIYDCSFCSESKRLTQPNPRSVNNILEELSIRQQQGFKAVFFDDSTFGAYKHIKELLPKLESIDLQFGCLNRFNHLQKFTVVEDYRKAGFVYFYCAIEQFNDVMLSRMNKNITTKNMKKAMENLQESGIALGVSLLYGLPYETSDSVKATLDFVAEWVDAGVIRLVSESVLSLHPGTVEGAALISGFDRTPPNQGFPYTRFEEGQWYHPKNVTGDYLNKIAELSENRFGKVLVRNRHSWYRKEGLLTFARPDDSQESDILKLATQRFGQCG